MALPYQVFKPDGTPLFSFPTGRVRMGRSGGRFTTGTSGSGSYPVPGATPGNCWVATRRTSFGGNQPVITVANGTINWSFRNLPTWLPNVSVEVEYGFV